MLYALGVLFYGGLSNTWDEIRWVGVLQRIAICYFFGAIVFLNLRAARAGFAIGRVAEAIPHYWHGCRCPTLARGITRAEGNLAGHVDRLLLPGRSLVP